MFLSGFVNITCSSSVCEAYRASQVTAIGNVYYSKSSVAFMFRTDSAVLRAAFESFSSGIVYAFSVPSVFFCSQILIIVTPIEFRVFSMFRTCFFDVYFVVSFQNCGVQDLKAFGTYTFGLLDYLRDISPLVVVKRF